MNNDKHNYKLDLISGIDDDILERTTQRRYALSQRRRRGGLSKRLAVIAVAAVLAVCLVATGVIGAMLWQNGDDHGEDLLLTSDGRRIPIFQGISVSKERPDITNTAKAQSGVQTLSLSSKPAINVADPFGNIIIGGGIEAAATEAIAVESGAEKIYYAEKYEDVYVTVHVSNPDGVEILSFTLNGEKYSSYMFEKGSDLQNLVLKCNVGGVEGLLEYTVDGIKYVDGTEIKDARMEGDRTVKVGVYTSNQPTAVVSGERIGFNELSFSVVVNDPHPLISKEGERVYAVMYDGLRIIDKKPITVGETTDVTFESLKTNKLYQYGIAAVYDALDGKGERVHILYSNAFYTNEIAAFGRFTTTDSSIKFELLWAEGFDNASSCRISLWKDDVKIRDIAPDAREIDGLYSGNSYVIKVEYDNNGVTESISLSFSTEKNPVPELSITIDSVSADSVRFSVEESDPRDCGKIVGVELVHETQGTTIVSDTATGYITGLYSDSSYTLRVIYEYDLNDGEGAKTLKRVKSFNTQANTAPRLWVHLGERTYDTITFSLNASDPDNLLKIESIELAGEINETIVAPSVDTRKFTGLCAGRNYQLVIYYSYDLGDGNGVVKKSISTTAYTKNYVSPSLSLEIVDVSKDAVNFSISFSDIDSVGKIEKIELFSGESLVAITQDITSGAFTDLRPNTSYTIRVTYSYDLKNGNGVSTVYKQISFTSASD